MQYGDKVVQVGLLSSKPLQLLCEFTKRLGRYIYGKTLSMYGKTTSFGLMTEDMCWLYRLHDAQKKIQAFPGYKFLPQHSKTH